MFSLSKLNQGKPLHQSRSRSFVIWLLLGWLAFGLAKADAAQYVVVVMDDSGSMADRMRNGSRARRIDAAKQALKVVLSEVPADAHVGVLALNSGWIIPLQRVDRTNIESQVNRLRASGGTPLGAMIKMGVDELLQTRAEQKYGDYRLLVVTDGEASDQALLDFLLPDVMTRGLTVDVIGVDMQSEHSLATYVDNYRRADDPESLTTAIKESLAESTDTDSDSTESDFEIVAGLDPELASQILTALSTTNDAPIGGANPTEEASVGNSYSIPMPSSGGSNRGGRRRSGGSFVSSIFCLMIVFFMVSMISSVMKAAARRR